MIGMVQRCDMVEGIQVQEQELPRFLRRRYFGMVLHTW
jgi:hypothetical protein